MQVVISKGVSKGKRVYHRPGCMYMKRIKYGNIRSMTEKKAKRLEIRECKYCSGLIGDYRCREHDIEYWERKKGLKFTYYKDENAVQIQTDVGAWKLQENSKGLYYLKHKNVYTQDMSSDEIKNGSYHYQKDVKSTDSFASLVQYIIDHDRAKAIIMDDYRKLPQKTKKQKIYYKIAERKHRRNMNRKIDAIFAAIERENPELKRVSMC